MNGLIVATITGGLVVDRYGGDFGQPLVDVVAWLVLLRLWGVVDRAERPALLACLVFATAGELFLSLGWGLYEYRLGNLPLFVPPGHVLLYFLGTRLAGRIPDGAEWWIAAVAAPLVAGLAFTGRDTLGPILFTLFLVCMVFGGSRKLYATMFALSLAMELWGTWLGNWTWSSRVPWTGLAADNPPLAAGAFYATLDLLVVSAAVAWRREPRANRS